MVLDQAIIGEARRARDLRHQFHRIPELGYEEFKTAALIRLELGRLNIPFVDSIPTAPTATVAWIGDTSKPCIAFRADIDGLPIFEQTGLPYASEHEGRMHACGHDGHTATLLGFAGLIAGVIDQLPICVKLIWQPAEEGGGGADRLVEAGVLDGRLGPKVSAIFGLHGWPGLPLGYVATRAGALMASADNFIAEFVGKPSHGAYPHLGRDPILAAAKGICSLQSIVSREVDPTEPAVVSVGVIQGGTAENIIPMRASFQGTARALNDRVRAILAGAIRRRLEGVALETDCQLNFTWLPRYPVTENDPKMADYVSAIARKTLGDSGFLNVQRPSMGAEDFSYYLQKVPGCFFFLGMCPPGQDDYPQLHTPRYDFVDEGIEVGMRMYLSLARNWPLASK